MYLSEKCVQNGSDAHTPSMEHVRHASPLNVELNGLDKAALQRQRVTMI